MNRAVVDSAEFCKGTTEKVNKLTADTTTFMENFQTTFNSNTMTANDALKSLGSLFKTKKTKLQEIRTGLKTDHEAFRPPSPLKFPSFKMNWQRRVLWRWGLSPPDRDRSAGASKWVND
ncbi:unnamed protein product [Lactuca virosa]|uniref:Uncharacterized protein n=1 Tax=Lactuca virosa TaxID=75947 RepID=A0AAU9LJH8_9ASTR|nr:unnamed protein product [Lactuca virosa]